jgi:hypothetical protein
LRAEDFQMAERDRLVNGKGFTHLDTDGSVKIDAYKVVNYPVLLQSLVATSINRRKNIRCNSSLYIPSQTAHSTAATLLTCFPVSSSLIFQSR